MAFGFDSKKKILAGKQKENIFWDWYQNNSAMLFNFETDREKIFDLLGSKLSEVHPQLTFEFGPVNNNKREFIISANGIKSAFPAVESLYNAAPQLQNWDIKKFRQRRHPLSKINIANKSVSGEDIHYQLIEANKIGIILFLDGYNESEKTMYKQIGYLMLDEALGEYDVETKLGAIDFRPRDSKDFEGARKLNEFAEEFDRAYSKLNKLH